MLDKIRYVCYNINNRLVLKPRNINVGRDDPARREFDYILVFAGGTSGAPCPTWHYKTHIINYNTQREVKSNGIIRKA